MRHLPQMLRTTPPDLILWDVVREHIDEAAFQYRQWRSALFSPRYCLDQLRSGLEDQLEAHLIGIDIAGPAATERLLFPELEEMTSSGRTTVAALALLRSRERNAWYELLDFLSSSEDSEHRHAMIEAIAIHEEPRFEVVLREAFERSRSPSEKAALLEVFAELWLDPGDSLGDCFDTGFVPLERLAVTTAGYARRLDLAHLVERNLRSQDTTLRDAAIEAGLFLGLTTAWLVCRQRAAFADGDCSESLRLIGLLGSPYDHETIRGHLESRSTRKQALQALGFTGRIENVRHCIMHLESSDVRVAKLAAEAIALITGFNHFSVKAFRQTPEPVVVDDECGDALIASNDDDLYADLVPDGTDELPHLDPFSIARWWEANRDKFSADRRYISGEVYSPKTLVKALRHGPMRRRPTHALDLAIRTGGRRQVTTSAFTGRQLRELDALSDLTDADLVHHFENGNGMS